MSSRYSLNSIGERHRQLVIASRVLIFGKLDSVAAGINDVNRVTRTLAMQAHAIGFDRLAFQLFDQLLRIARSFNIEGVMRHAGRALFRGIEQT